MNTTNDNNKWWWKKYEIRCMPNGFGPRTDIISANTFEEAKKIIKSISKALCSSTCTLYNCKTI